MRASLFFHLLRAVMLCWITVSMSGCANHARLAAWEAAGWRLGWVYRIVERRDLKDIDTLKCVPGVSPGRTANDRFAVVRYSTGSRSRPTVAVPIPEFLELEAGDTVHVNVRDCEKPIVRVSG